MWFLFGLVTLICFFTFNVYKKVNASWKGEKASFEDIKFQYKINKDKDEISSVLIGISGPNSFDFTLKRESATDRFFKSIGLAKEHQIGHSEFDDLVYVVSDHNPLHKEISNNSDIVNAVLKLFTSRSGVGVNIHEIRCNSGRIWFTYKPRLGFEEEDIDKLAKETVPSLKIISDNLKNQEPLSSSKWKDPFVFKAAIILAISSGLFLNGLAHFYRLNFIDIPFTLDTNQLLTQGALYSAGIVTLLIIMTLFILGRSSRTHLVLVELLLVGSIGTYLTISAQMRDLNMEMDESLAMEYEVEIRDMEIDSGRRSTNYNLYVDDWVGEKNTKRIEVPSSFYHSVNIGNNLLIKQKEGYLDFRWVSEINKIH
jgi:hypothetical protein